MASGHRHSHLVVHGSTPVHRLPPEVKIAATLAVVVAVVATPREAIPAFGAHLALILAVAAAARIPPASLLGRLVIEIPFVAFAAFLPLVGGGERVDVGPLALSVEGSWAAWNILAKATLGVLAASVLAATTEVPDLLVGLRRLRVPGPIVAIAAFMTRYLDVLVAQLHRMQVARVSRGDDPRWWWQARAVATTAGALFLRSYERGERVYLAMCARGYDGGIPVLDHRPAGGAREWALASLPVVAAVAVTVTALTWS